MRVHLIHAHPEPRSFVAAMRDVAVAAFVSSGHLVTVSDLYAMGFNPVASAADFQDRADPDYLVYALEQRHGMKTETLAPDIKAELDHVLSADLLVFTFPVFWFSTPAILKGWIDRVLVSGVTYGGRRVYGAGGLHGKRAFPIFSLGGRDHMFGPNGLHGDLVGPSGMMRHFLQGTLGYVGLDVYDPFIAYHVPYVDAADRAAILSSLEQTITDLDRRPVLQKPDLSDFDEEFAPKCK